MKKFSPWVMHQIRSQEFQRSPGPVAGVPPCALTGYGRGGAAAGDGAGAGRGSGPGEGLQATAMAAQPARADPNSRDERRSLPDPFTKGEYGAGDSPAQKSGRPEPPASV